MSMISPVQSDDLVIVANVTAFSAVVAVGVYGDMVGDMDNVAAYPTTTYVIAAVCGIVAAVLVLLSGCN